MYLIHKPEETHEGAATRATMGPTMGPAMEPTKARVMMTMGAIEWEQANEQKEMHKQEHMCVQTSTSMGMCKCKPGPSEQA